MKFESAWGQLVFEGFHQAIIEAYDGEKNTIVTQPVYAEVEVIEWNSNNTESYNC